MQIRYVFNSTTLVESFNHNFVFSSIISVATFKLTCFTISWQNYDAVKDRRNTLLRTLFIQLLICPFIFHFHQFKSATVTTQAQ